MDLKMWIVSNLELKENKWGREKSGKSVSQLVRMALLDLEKDFSKTIEETKMSWRNRGFYNGRQSGIKEGDKIGYKRGMNNWAIWCYCYRCRKPLFIKPNSEDHKEVIEEMKGRLKHAQCPEE